MSESELADRYRTRIESAGTREARVDEVTARGLQRLGEGLWVTLTVVPEHPGAMHLDSRTADQMLGWQRSLVRPSLWDGPMFERLDSRIGVHCTELLYEHQTTGEADYRFLQLHDDGSGFAAAAFMNPEEPSIRKHDDPTDGHGLPLSDVGLTAYLIEELNLLSQHAVANTGTWGTAIAEATVTLTGEYRGRPLLLCRLDAIENFTPVRPTRVVHTTPTSRRAVDLTEITSGARGLLAATYLVLAELQQAFGVAEAPFIDVDGNLLLSQVPQRNRPAAQQWVDHTGATTA